MNISDEILKIHNDLSLSFVQKAVAEVMLRLKQDEAQQRPWVIVILAGLPTKDERSEIQRLLEAKGCTKVSVAERAPCHHSDFAIRLTPPSQ